MIRIKYYAALAFICLSTVLKAQDKSQIVNLNKAGELSSYIPTDQAINLTHLKINGKINAVDFKHLRDHFMNLVELDLSTADIKNYVGKNGTLDQFHVYKSNTVPSYAFSEKTDYAPKERTALQKVILPTSIDRIESFAFAYCPNLEILVLRGAVPPKLNETALSPKRTVVFVPAGTKDIYSQNKDWAQYNIIDSEPVQVEIKLKKDEDLATELLRKGYQPKHVHYLILSGVVDANDLKIIRDYMLDLISIEFKNTDLTEIPDHTFAQKGNLLEVSLPNNLKSIGSNAFSGCVRLGPTLTLPSSVTTISDGAFANCPSLNEVQATGNQITVIGENIFGDNQKNKLLFNK